MTRLTYGEVDLVAAIQSADGSPHLLGALAVLATLRKALPCVVDDDGAVPWLVDWERLDEWSGPWSSTERTRVRLAVSLFEGDLGHAAGSFDERNWSALLDALAIARGR